MPRTQGDKEFSKLSFEDVMERLEDVVQQLERGEAPLEDALATFERGVALSRVGNQRLDQAERRIEQLLKSGETVPLQDESGEAPARGSRRSTGGSRKANSSKEPTDDE